MNTIGTDHSQDADSWQQRLHLDAPLVLLLIAVCSLGIMVLYSASNQNTGVAMAQVTRLGIGFAALFLVAQVHPRWLRLIAPWLFGIGILLLCAVTWFGDVGKGAQRWLDLGIVRFQPAEMMKLAVPMMVAWLLRDARLPPRALHLVLAGIALAVPTILIARQPDLGTALLVACSGFFVLFLAGLSWRVLIYCSLLATASAPFLWYFMRDYQQQRVLTFLNPEHDPLGAGYHIIQSKIALGSGGLYGKGWLNGTQSQLEFLPERSTDFIFAVLGEEFGLIGILLLISLYLFIMFRSMLIASQAQDTFTRLLGGSLALTFMVYIIVNTGMVTGLLPVVGLPLPLVSYGGTSMVTLMAGFGMLMSIHTHRKLLST